MNVTSILTVGYENKPPIRATARLYYLACLRMCCIIGFVIEKKVQKHRMADHNEIRQNHQYWLSRSPEERLSAVEFLRCQLYGDTKRLQRTARVVKR